ncbi:MAG TPA: hypothetical protein EYG90_00915 [Campylobacterales bacterium]|nr:hypothetical protein [Campylobacterales bacterium]
MFTNQKKQILILLTTIGFLGCTVPTNTITITEASKRQNREPIRHIPKEQRVKEEILIGNNPNLGTLVNVPKNNPTVGTKVIKEERSVVSSGRDHLHGGKMERMDFPVDEYRHLKKIGRSTVSGVVYLQNSYNDQKIVGKKVKLLLNPVTSYSRQWYQESYLGKYKMSPVDKRLYKYLQSSYSSENGLFDFFGIAKGNYYLIATVSCGQECGFDSKETIRLVKEISVGSGVTKVELMKHVP